MKTIIFGAAGLLLSGTALAGVVPNKGMDRTTAAAPAAAKDADILNDSMIGNAITIDWPAKAAGQDKAMDESKAIEAGVQSKPEMAEAETSSTDVMSDAADDGKTGVGGPEESSDTPAVRAFAARDYPPCTSQADDSCIQLYERGVPESLASWQASQGGQQVAMGGPEEPAEDAIKAQGEESAADQPLPEDAVMPASEDMVEKDAPDTSAI